MAHITIAIDGRSSCGKSTLAKEIAKELGYRHIDSGALYRAVTHYFLEEQIDYNDPQQVGPLMDTIEIHISTNPEGISEVLLHGTPLHAELRSTQVNEHVSHVASLGIVRRRLVEMQQQLGLEGGIVMDGRDIGSVVFPHAELKLFITASLDTRTQRRWQELADQGVHLSIEAVRENLAKRDEIDSTREISPLTQTTDAVQIDNTNLSKREQLLMVTALARHRASIRDGVI